jgi:hypothetical protein
VNANRICSAICLIGCFVSPSLADERIATQKSADVYDLRTEVTRKSADETPTPSTISDVFRNLAIEPGRTISLDSTLDYSPAVTVAITIQCVVCNSATASLGASGLVLVARWLAPNAELFVATENKSTIGFPYWDAGGAIFNVYGSQFRLTLQNTGAETIKIQQLTMFLRNR